MSYTRYQYVHSYPRDTFKAKTLYTQQQTRSHDSDSTCEQRNSYEPRPRDKVKVELCKNYLQNRQCPYRGKCRFAHGLEELLRNSDLGQNFRTKNCKVFFDKKYCKFGERCNFKHNSDETEGVACGKIVRSMVDYPEILLPGRRQESKIMDMLQGGLTKQG